MENLPILMYALIVILRMAIKFDSKGGVSCGGVKGKLYKLFDMYHGNIDISISNTSCHLEKARYLICPSKDKQVDPDPLVYGETKEELCKRIENSARGAKRSREILENPSVELIATIKDCNGDFET